LLLKAAGQQLACTQHPTTHCAGLGWVCLNHQLLHIAWCQHNIQLHYWCVQTGFTAGGRLPQESRAPKLRLFCVQTALDAINWCW
jgi:hypothetical protein